MIKTPEHKALAQRIRQAELELHAARVTLARAKRELAEAKQAWRVYRTNHPLGTTTRIGPKVVEQVRTALSPLDLKRPPQIAKETGRSVQAVRMALGQLVAEGRAIRRGKPFQRTFYLLKPERGGIGERDLADSMCCGSGA